jgi:GTP-binding protein
MPLTLAIVGRPNVGKSTLFNRLAGRRVAIVHDTPGVTRDRAMAETDFSGLKLRIIDTAGFEKGAPESLQARMLAQTRAAIAEADVSLFLVDAREGVTPGDEIIAETLRKGGKPVLLAANKCEGREAQASVTEAYRLGFGEAIALSAEHGIGLGELHEALSALAEEHETAEAEADEAEDHGARPLRIAIAGRPNVGKSSLMNRILGEDRSLTGPEAGITRDAVAATWQWQGREIVLHDTAGLRKKARIVEKLEKMSVDSTLQAVRFADCVVLVMDATQAFEKQELVIADLIAREGRALIFAINKWDLVEDRKKAMSALREQCDRLLPQIGGATMVPLSAQTGEGMDKLLPAVTEADRIWNTRVPTAGLNRFLADALSRHPPPAVHGRRIRIRYMTQTKARPPTFVLFGTQLDELPQSYLRYLTNELRKSFGLAGTPIRLMLRSAKNPYVE